MAIIQQPDDESLLAAALAYAKRGWYVFPVHSTRDGACTCDHAHCSAPGKHPRTHHGVLDATTDTAQIERWWAQWPWANIGVNCGLSGLLVIDVDPRNGGAASLAAWERAHGPLPPTLRARTPSGGFHAYYSVERMPRRGCLGPGVDLQGAGAYVVAPPSQSLEGEYVWMTT